MKTQEAFDNRDRFVELGIVIAALRKKAGLSQVELADQAHISRSTVSAIESANSIRSFSVDVLFRIADVLEISAGDLLNSSLPETKS